jgi:very-short-patch-repair endonuclease
LGITVLRFTDDDVMDNIDNVLRSIQEFILYFEEKAEITHPSVPS